MSHEAHALIRLIASCVLSISLAGVAAAEIDREVTRADMRQIYAAVEKILPLSVDDQAFRSPDKRETLREALSELASQASHLTLHVGSQDPRIQYLGGSLARESAETLRRFDAGDLQAAQFFSRRLTDFCVTCHSRLPSPADSLLTKNFLSNEKLARLPLTQQAELQVATRRFDDALDSYEAIIASRHVRPAELLEPLTQYLTVAIRVKNDLARPVPTLKKLLARTDLWDNLRADVERWMQTLERYAGETQSEPTIASARAVLGEVRHFVRYPSDRQALVHYLLASSRLHRYLEKHAGQADRDVAEAYYLIGLNERRIHVDYRFYWEADFYLETAIRLAPKDPIAKQAFALLEEETVLGWSGSGGSHVPEDVRSHLEELRTLVYSN